MSNHKFIDRLLPDEKLEPGQSLVSNNGRFQLSMQTDGSLVLYMLTLPRPNMPMHEPYRIWYAVYNPEVATSGYHHCVMQTDGNLVVYSATYPLWNSGTNGHPGSYVVVQDDGNMVIYQRSVPPGQIRALWSANSGEWGPKLPPTGPAAAPGDTMYPGEILPIGQPLTSKNGRYKFYFQSDSNLVVYDGSTPIWSLPEPPGRGDVCILQQDGNLVMYEWWGIPIWSSGSAGHNLGKLVMQDDGNLVIYNIHDVATWSTRSGNIF